MSASKDLTENKAKSAPLDFTEKTKDLEKNTNQSETSLVHKNCSKLVNATIVFERTKNYRTNVSPDTFFPFEKLPPPDHDRHNKNFCFEILPFVSSVKETCKREVTMWTDKKCQKTLILYDRQCIVRKHRPNARTKFYIERDKKNHFQQMVQNYAPSKEADRSIEPDTDSSEPPGLQPQSDIESDKKEEHDTPTPETARRCKSVIRK